MRLRAIGRRLRARPVDIGDPDRGQPPAGASAAAETAPWITAAPARGRQVRATAARSRSRSIFSPSYDRAEPFGIRLEASPRHCDGLLVTGPVTRNMAAPLRKTFDAVPQPRVVVAVGDCARDCGVFRGAYGVEVPSSDVVPVDLEIPGCPPDPAAIGTRPPGTGRDVTAALLVATALMGLAGTDGRGDRPRSVTHRPVVRTDHRRLCPRLRRRRVTSCTRVIPLRCTRPLSCRSRASRSALDRFGALFVVITAVVGICAMVFRVGYDGHGLASRTASSILPLFVTSLLLVPAASNVTTFLFLWELMATTSLLLVLSDHARRSEVQVAGQWYAVMTQVGAAALILGLVLLATRSGSQSFTVIAAHSAHLPGVGAQHDLPASR